MCIVLKVDLRCCRGCRKWMCTNLKRIAGVEQVEVGDDETTLVVCGKGFDEAEILRQVKKRKSRSAVEVVSRIVHDVSKTLHNIDAGGRLVDAEGMQPRPEPGLKPEPEPKPKPEPGLEPEPEPKPKPKLEVNAETSEPEPESKLKLKPKPKPTPIGEYHVEEMHQHEEESNSPRKVDTLVTERTFEEFQGVKIRTRVTTSKDVCTCIRVEETQFIIDKYCHSPLNSIIGLFEQQEACVRKGTALSFEER